MLYNEELETGYFNAAITGSVFTTMFFYRKYNKMVVSDFKKKIFKCDQTAKQNSYLISYRCVLYGWGVELGFHPCTCSRYVLPIRWLKQWQRRRRIYPESGTLLFMDWDSGSSFLVNISGYGGSTQLTLSFPIGRNERTMFIYIKQIRRDGMVLYFIDAQI